MSKMVPEGTMVIMGLGVAGLTAALEALNKGKQIEIFTDREPGLYTRPQRIHLDDNPSSKHNNVKYLYGLANKKNPADMKFIDELNKANNAVELKKLERFLYRKLCEKLQKGGQSIDSIIHGPNAKLTRIDKKSGKLYYQTEGMPGETTIQFSHIVAADGAHHPTANFLKEQGAITEKELTHTKLKNQGRHLYHGTICVEINGGQETLATRKAERQADDIYQLDLLKNYKPLDWNRTFLPWAYRFPNSKRNKFFYAGEIPQSIHDIQDPAEKNKALINWFGVSLKHINNLKDEDIVLKDYDKDYTSEKYLNKYKNLVPQEAYGTEEHTKKIQELMVKKKALRATTFEMNMHKANSPIVSLGNERYFISLGDGYFSPHYQTQRGANNAIQSARCIGAALSKATDKQSSKFDSKLFIKHMNTITKNYETVLDDCNDQQSSKKTADEYKAEILDRVSKLCVYIASMDPTSHKHQVMMGIVEPEKPKVASQEAGVEAAKELQNRKENLIAQLVEGEDKFASKNDLTALYETMLKLKHYAGEHRQSAFSYYVKKTMLLMVTVCSFGIGFVIAEAYQKSTTGLSLVHTLFNRKRQTNTELMIDQSLGLMDHMVNIGADPTDNAMVKVPMAPPALGPKK